MQIKGWKQVLGFTYLQNIKSKSFRVGTTVMAAILALACIAINILPAVLGGGSDDGIFGGIVGGSSEKGIETVYVLDESELAVKADFSALAEAGVAFTEISADKLEETALSVAESEAAEVVLHIFYTNITTDLESDIDDGVNRLKVQVFRPQSEELVSSDAAETFAGYARNRLKDAVLLSYGVSEENLDEVQIEIEKSAEVYSSEPEKSIVQQVAGALVPMLSALLLFCFIISYSQLIAQAIATEKTSRVMELLLTSVRPLAIIVGKVLGMLLVCVTQLAIFGVVGGTAFLVSMPFGFIPQLAGELGSAVGEAGAVMGEAGAAAGADFGSAFSSGMEVLSTELSTIIPGFDFVSLLLIFLNFVMGFLFYALLAGLVGASVSRIEDMAQALQPLMLVSMVGFFLSYFSSVFTIENGGEPNAIMIFSRYFPISSPFALPSAILLGQMSLAEAGIATLFLAVMLVLTAMLVAKIYHHIILYSGNPLKLTQFFGFLKKEK